MRNKHLIALLIITMLFAQQDEVKIHSVKIVGNELTSESMIRYSAGLNVGDVITHGDFSRAVKRLWQLGLFSDIQIELLAETDDGLDVAIIVEENFILNKVKYQGNKKIKDKKFDEELGLRKGMRIRSALPTESITKIKDLYAEDGYLLTEVDFQLEVPDDSEDPDEKKNKKRKIKKITKKSDQKDRMRDRTDLRHNEDGNGKEFQHEIDLLTEDETQFEFQEDLETTDDVKKEKTRNLVFTIKENQKVKLREIEIEGNEQFSDFRLRRKLAETKMQRWYLFWRSYFDEKKFEEDKLKLIDFYHNEGYRDAAIVTDSIFYDASKKSMSILLHINEGPQYHYRNFSWEGATLHSDEELSRALDLKKGDTYNEEEFNLAVFERMHGLYMDKGYIYSNISPRITPVGQDSLDIHFEITENHKVFVRNIYVQGNSKTRDNVIRRELHVFPGDVFNRNLLQRSARELFILNYFSNVIPDVLPVDEDEIDLEITVEEKSSDRANANVGYSGVYGLMGGGGVEFNNFRGLGQQLVMSYQVGSQGTTNYYNTATQGAKYKSFSISFMDPMIFDTPNRVGFSFYNSFRGRSAGFGIPLDIQVIGGSVQWGRRFKWPDDYFRGYWVLNSSLKKYDGSDEDIETYAAGLNQSRGLNISQVISRDSRDRAEFTSSGSRFTWEATLSGGPLGGNENFLKHVLNLEWFTPTFSKFVLMNSLKIGVVNPIYSIEERTVIPYDEKFIMGGNGIPYGNMLRGYAENSIGPKSSSGSTIYGTNMLRFVTELRFPFSENPVIYGLAFAEGGNVWNSSAMTEPFNIPRSGPLSLRRSAGFGVRFFMPMIGMLGFDMGYGFDDNDGNGKPEGWNYTIIFGQQF